MTYKTPEGLTESDFNLNAGDIPQSFEENGHQRYLWGVAPSLEQSEAIIDEAVNAGVMLVIRRRYAGGFAVFTERQH